jgi:hypothetical protein
MEDAMENDHKLELDISEDEIKENFKLLTQRPISERTLSVGKCIAKIAQWHVIEAIKLGLMPLRVGNYYLIKADVLDNLFDKLDKNTIEQEKKLEKANHRPN